MNPDAIRKMLNQQPFRPFEVGRSGERHLVRHPEFAILMVSQIVVTNPLEDQGAFLSLKHVTELRPVQPQPSSEAN